ncbi:hypothetical protein MtrunA17_Chr1g0150251 [Medicago truncatula]|uniref:Uncharacterized protein n=1 Tax=Medicago truncatula TaxID=3880 RepID=A0A396JIA0_MEDTR|nr:hypothetical protein MtrunA17_Chr1g0150251 [Medicago truncatula]
MSGKCNPSVFESVGFCGGGCSWGCLRGWVGSCLLGLLLWGSFGCAFGSVCGA